MLPLFIIFFQTTYIYLSYKAPNTDQSLVLNISSIRQNYISFVQKIIYRNLPGFVLAP